jgi:hypothetical protein
MIKTKIAIYIRARVEHYSICLCKLLGTYLCAKFKPIKDPKECATKYTLLMPFDWRYISITRINASSISSAEQLHG